MVDKSVAFLDKKQALLNQLEQIQLKINKFEDKRTKLITKLAKKFNLIDLDPKIIEQEFSLIREKYAAVLNNPMSAHKSKKN